MKTEEKIKTENEQDNTNSTGNINNDPIRKRPDEPNPNKEQQPWKNPDPTTPEKEHIKEPYAEEDVRLDKENETIENNKTANTDINPTEENKKENNPTYKPTYPDPDEKTRTGNDVERENQQREYKNPNLDKNRV